MEMIKSPKAIAVVTTALFLASLLWLMNTTRMNGSLEANLQKEKVRTESLLSEKLLLEKDIQKMKDQLASMRGKNEDLDKLYAATSSKLQQQEADYNRMKRENASLAQIKKQKQELIALKSELENELQRLKTSYAELENKNREMNQAIASLEERNKLLTDDLHRAMLASIDHSQIQATKKRDDRLTVKASRTKKLMANFEVPASLKNITFRIIDPKGKALNSDKGLISSSVTLSDKSYVASADGNATGNKLQNVEMTYIPKQKLKSGVYTVEILNENLYVGSLKVKLK